MARSLKHEVVIIGGGSAGIATASSMLKRRPSLDIAIVEPSGPRTLATSNQLTTSKSSGASTPILLLLRESCGPAVDPLAGPALGAQGMPGRAPQPPT